jgi:cell shape-determining protein MreC
MKKLTFGKTHKMNSSKRQASYASYYFDFLENLNSDSKLDLISQLSQSLKSDKTDNTSLDSLFGAYKSKETADEILAEIRSSRVSNRNIEPL